MVMVAIVMMVMVVTAQSIVLRLEMVVMEPTLVIMTEEIALIMTEEIAMIVTMVVLSDDANIVPPDADLVVVGLDLPAAMTLTAAFVILAVALLRVVPSAALLGQLSSRTPPLLLALPIALPRNAASNKSLPAVVLSHAESLDSVLIPSEMDSLVPEVYVLHKNVVYLRAKITHALLKGLASRCLLLFVVDNSLV
jgi:hypothetical protein